jgi:hypothetical protein
MGLLDTETNDVDGVSCWSGDESSKICTVVHQNKIGQSVTLDSFTIQRFVSCNWDVCAGPCGKFSQYDASFGNAAP